MSNLVIQLYLPLVAQATNILTLLSGLAQLSPFSASGLTNALASIYSPIIIPLFPFTKSINNASAEFDSNTGDNLSSLDNKVGLSLGNEVNLELNNEVGARLDKKVRLALYDNAIRVIENWEMIYNTDVTYVKSPNPINLLVNIAKNATNLLISDKKNQLKDKKKHWKKKL